MFDVVVLACTVIIGEIATWFVILAKVENVACHQ